MTDEARKSESDREPPLQRELTPPPIQQPAAPPTEPREVSHPPRAKDLSGRQTYNVVTDVAIGPNLRLRDNRLQGIAILVTVVLGAGIGFFVKPGRDPLGGALIGAFIGLLAGLFGSGIFLMIFRATQHARGKHD